MAGRLHGATDATDYFYFFCPKCPNSRLLRILDYRFTRDEAGDNYIENRKRKACRTFIVAFDIACENCSFRDWVKVSNIGWQGGTHAETLRQETI